MSARSPGSAGSAGSSGSSGSAGSSGSVSPSMVPAGRTPRLLAGAAAAVAILTAAAAGLLSGPVAAATALGTVAAAVTRPVGGARVKRVVGVLTTVAVFVTAIGIVRSVPAAGGDPSAALRVLAVMLSFLCVALPPSWAGVRDHRMWLGLTAGLLVAAAARSVDVLPGLALSWVLLLGAVAALQRASVTAHLEPADRHGPTTGGAAPAGAVVLAAGCTLLACAAVPARVDGSSLVSTLASHFDATAAQPATHATAGVDTRGTGVLDLSVRGALPDTPLISVPADSPPLWRGTTYATYTGRSWHAAATHVSPARFAGLHGDDVRLAAAEGRPSRRYDVRLLEPGLLLVWAPGAVLRVSGAIQGLLPADGSVKRFTAGSTTYDVTSTAPSRQTVDPGAAPPGARWTRLPAEVPEEVRRLAATLTAGHGGVSARVAAIEAYLRGHETYTLAAPKPPRGTDAVDAFLFGSHEGFCEQFASALAVLLRAAGTPARVVSGLAYGTMAGDRRVLSADDAHAWVEAWHPGRGWEPTDPTAGVSLTPVQPSWPSRVWGWLGAHAALGAAGGGGLLLAGAVWSALQAARGRSRRSRRWSRWWRGRRAAPVGPVHRAWLRLMAGVPSAQRRSPAETPREWAARIEPCLLPAVAVLERELWGATPPDAAAAAGAVTAFAGAGGGRR